jgi:lysozyme
MRITQARAETYLLRDVQAAAAAVNRLVTASITQEEFDALVDFAFNAGIGSLEHSTLLHDLNAHDYAGAAKQFEVWDHASGKVVAGLLRRRFAEEHLLVKGETAA